MKLEHLRQLRRLIEKAVQEALSDEEAFSGADLFPVWKQGVFHTGDRRKHEGQLYKCLQDHDSTEVPTWTPDASPSLWVRIDDPSQEWPEWIQPTGATDAYRLGAKVSYKNKHWINDLDYNTYAPDVYGWHEA